MAVVPDETADGGCVNCAFETCAFGQSCWMQADQARTHGAISRVSPGIDLGRKERQGLNGRGAAPGPRT